jgi:hypothetical protein
MTRSLPLEANANFFASFFGRQDRQRRRAFGERALAGLEIIAITVVVAAQHRAVEKLPRRLQIGFFVWTVPGKSKIFSLDERQEHLAPAKVDFFHAAGRYFTYAGNGNVADPHPIYAAAFCRR